MGSFSQSCHGQCRALTEALVRWNPSYKALLVTVELLGCCLVQAVVFCHPPTVPASLWVFYRQCHPWHGLSLSVSMLACLAGPLCPLPPTGYGSGGKENLNSGFAHGSNNSKLSSCIILLILKRACFLSFTMCSVELLAPQAGKQRGLFIAGCQTVACSGRRCCWPWV